MGEYCPSKGEQLQSYLLNRIGDLSVIPLEDFTVEDLRLLIGQGIGLNYLVSLAIEKLQLDLFAEGDFFPGDLLSSVLKIPTTFWKENKNLWAQINILIGNRKNDLIENKIFFSQFELAKTFV